MRHLLKYAALAAGSLWLAACGPVYKTYTNYTPPPDQRGKSCVLQCESQRAQCDSQCRRDYSQCRQEAKSEGRMRYLSARESYLNQKAACLDRGNKDCAKKFSEPSENSYVNDSHCQEDCGCMTHYDRCFEVCGGQVQRYTRCESNCQ